MAEARTAAVTWEGSLLDGGGTIDSVTSGSFGGLAVTWASRTSDHAGRTSPEELLASAHASCFAMACSNELSKAGHAPERLSVTATVTGEKADRWSVVSSALTVRGRVPGIDDATFATLAEAAKDGCPISRALAGNVLLSVDAALET